MDRGAWWATIHGTHKRVGHDFATKQQQTSLGHCFIGKMDKEYLPTS